MPYTELIPHAALRPFVDRLWTSDGPTLVPRYILPDGCIDLLIDLDGGDAIAVGTMTRATVIAPSAVAARILAVRFRPGGALPFLRVPVDELTDRVVDCATLGLRWLAGIATPAALERALLAQLHAIDRPDPIVAHAVRALFGAAPPAIDALEDRTGWSRQHLARTFRRHVGVSPKKLARVARLQRVVAELQRPQRGPRTTLADLAVRVGYFDEAHLARDVRELIGLTPAAVRATAGSIFPIPSLLEDA